MVRFPVTAEAPAGIVGVRSVRPVTWKVIGMAVVSLPECPLTGLVARVSRTRTGVTGWKVDGIPFGVTGVEAADAVPVPAALLALTVNV
jgi:hypothetical protein